MSEKRVDDLPETSKEDDSKKEYEELSELLDNALADFASGKKVKEMDNSNQKGVDEKSKSDPQDVIWDDDFLRLTTAQLEENMQFLFDTDDTPLSGEEVSENIQRLAENAAADIVNDETSDFDFSDVVAQTLKDLSENTDNIQPNVPDHELVNMLGTFNSLTDPNTESSEIVPLMQQMMQILLSKEILVPSLTSLIEKYPQWLEDNKSKLTSHDYERYSEQLRLMKVVCIELEKETSSDNANIRDERFNRVLQLMQQMQDCGQPPSELVEDVNPIVAVDSQGNPQLSPNFISQCILM